MNHSRQEPPELDLSRHILPVAATMVGVCLTVVAIVRLIETSAAMTTVIDDFVALDGLVFLIATILSYLSIRSTTRRHRLEGYADAAFLIGLLLMVSTSFILALEIGQVVEKP